MADDSELQFDPKDPIFEETMNEVAKLLGKDQMRAPRNLYSGAMAGIVASSCADLPHPAMRENLRERLHEVLDQLFDAVVFK